ncbi:MAG: DUF5684 domain-containing protein, partial [Flavobacteriaceae bacterium]|nr:DUF5684 domain-containing protein [Flavobacteriaceae bacterium]
FTRAIFVLFGISALKLIIQVGIVITLEGIWKIYTKAGQKGWQALIPIYRFLVWLKIIKKPEYWILLLFLPIVSIVYSIWMVNLLAKRFGKNESYTLGLLFLPFIFYPRLGFGPEEYIEDTKEAYGVA